DAPLTQPITPHSRPQINQYLTNEGAGFNAYFLTDTKEISSETTEAYMAIRGSDGEFKLSDPSNWNDWFGNDASFALFDAHVPQAELATDGIKHTLDKLDEKGSKAKLDLTAHSLGTFVTVQGVAGLDPKDWDKVDEMVLFNGPDPTDSLKKMGLTNEQIKALGDKTTYYLNPFDMVSMLNRTAPYEEQFGNVKIMVPMTYTTSMVKDGSAHLFGQYQIGADGEILTASKDYHPELLEAGQKLAALNEKYLGL
ncbi:TPA: DUF2974 domain-containing protein, partial [Streptococcus equi subsp. equi]|nr:DUF2974 domain-containing protein [Streptococcus equi subsp. equi]